MTEMRLCKKCNIEKEQNTTNFKPIKGTKNGGFDYTCRDCVNAYYREYSKNKPEWRREKERKYKEKHPDKIKAKIARQRAKDKENKSWRKYISTEKTKEREKKRAKTPARIAWERQRWEKRKANGYNEKEKLRYAENPLTRRNNVNNRRMRLHGVKGSFTDEQLMEKYHYHGKSCYYCKTPLTIQEMTVEHRISISRNGTNFIANIVPACNSCNSSKRDKSEKEFAEWLVKLRAGQIRSRKRKKKIE